MSVLHNQSNENTHTAKALQSLWCHASILPDVVGTQLIQNTGNGHGICQELCRLPHLTVLVECIKVTSVQVRVPARHVDQNLFHLGLSELELAEEAPTPQIVVILVDLPQHITNFQMCLVVVCPMFFTAVYRNAAVRTLEIYVRRGSTRLRGLAGFEVHGIVDGTCRLVRRMRAVGMLAHESCALSYLRDGRVGE